MYARVIILMQNCEKRYVTRRTLHCGAKYIFSDPHKDRYTKHAYIDRGVVSCVDECSIQSPPPPRAESSHHADCSGRGVLTLQRGSVEHWLHAVMGESVYVEGGGGGYMIFQHSWRRGA